jgi:hypothetical protein
MSLSLATRGYLSRIAVLAEFGAGPDIVSSEEIKPNLIGAGLIEEEGPTISGVGVQAPQINAGAADQSPAAGDTPTIVGGELQVPDIDKAEES